MSFINFFKTTNVHVCYKRIRVHNIIIFFDICIYVKITL